MKRFLFVSILFLAVLSMGVSALSFSPSTTTLTAADPGDTVTDSTSVDIVSTEAAQHIIRFSDGELTHTSDSSETIDMTLPADITLPIAASADVNLQVNVPNNAYAGTYAGTLTATSTTSPAVTNDLTVSLTVNPNPEIDLPNTISTTIGQGMSKTVTFDIDNTGNTDITSMSISIEDLEGDGGDEISSGDIDFDYTTSIAYDDSIEVEVSIEIDDEQETGVYEGEFTVYYNNGESQDGTLRVTVREPSHQVDVLTATSSTTALDKIELGGSEQLRNQILTQTYYVSNKGDYNEEVTVDLVNFKTKFLASLGYSTSSTGSSSLSFDLGPGQNKAIVLEVTVPKNQDSGIESNAGTLRITSEETNVKNLPVSLETKTMLEFTKFEVEVGGKSATSVSNEETVSKTAKPGDEIKFDMSVKNLYSASDDVKIEDVTITITGLDDDFDNEEETDEFDISENQDRNKDLTITVPEKINEGTYDFEVFVSGDDENGATQELTWTVSIEVSKDSDDVRIEEAKFGSETLSCVRTTELRVTIANYGSDSQDKAALVIFSPDLGINENIMNIYLDENFDDDDNDFTKTVAISLPDSFKAGSYPVTIKAYRNNDKEMDEKIIYLKVEDCPQVDEEEEEETTVVITPPTTGTGSGSTGTTGTATGIVETVETSFTNSTAFILLLVGLDLVILLVAIVLVFKFLF